MTLIIAALSMRKYKGKARQEARHKLRERYTCKMHHFANKCRPKRPHAMQQSNHYYGCHEIRKGKEHHYNRHNDRCNYKKSPQVYRKNPQEYSYRRNPQERDSRKSLQEHNKGFKPCRMHGERSNHTYKDCRQNPRNQAKSKLGVSYNDNKCAYNSHHQDSRAQDNRYLSSNDESRGDNFTPMPSNGKASASVGGTLLTRTIT